MGFGNHYLGRKLWQRSNYENSWTSGKCHWPWWSRKEKDTTFRTFWEIPQISSGVPGASGCRSLRNNSGTSIARSRTLGGSNGAEPPEIFQNLASTDSMEAILYTSYDMYSYINIYIYDNGSKSWLPRRRPDSRKWFKAFFRRSWFRLFSRRLATSLFFEATYFLCQLARESVTLMRSSIAIPHVRVRALAVPKATWRKNIMQI